MKAVRVAHTSVWLLFAATGLQVIIQVLYALGWLPGPDADQSGDVSCVEPPCGPESLPPPEQLPIVVPFLVLGVASLLGVALLITAVMRPARTESHAAVSGLLLAVAPVLVLVGGELVPHVVTPCWFGEISGSANGPRRTASTGTDASTCSRTV